MNEPEQKKQFRPGGANSPLGFAIAVLGGIVSVRVIYELYKQNSKFDLAVVTVMSGIGIYHAWNYL